MVIILREMEMGRKIGEFAMTMNSIAVLIALSNQSVNIINYIEFYFHIHDILYTPDTTTNLISILNQIF